jgi:CelD/BcsL family acetyltransferase involved in cellulose biosynthesis
MDRASTGRSVDMDDRVAPQAVAAASAERPSSRATARVLRTTAEVEAMRASWCELQGQTLATDIDYFLTMARAHPEIVRPHVLVLERDGRPTTIMPAHLHAQRLSHFVAGIDAYRPSVRAVNVVYGGLLGDASPESLRIAVAALRRTLDAGEADVLLLRYLDPASALYRVVEACVPPLLRQHFGRRAAHWEMELDQSLEATLRTRSPKVRENVRRVARRIETDLGSSIAVRVHREPDDLETLVRDVDAVASLSYQRPGRPLFGHDGLERALAELGLSRGWFRGYVLYVDRAPVAFWTGYLYGGVFGQRGATGFDPRYARYSPGAFLMMRMISDLCDEGVGVFDLGRGDLEYKRWLGGRSRIEVDVRVHAARPAEIGVALLGSVANGAHALARSASSVADPNGRVRRWLHRRSAPQRLAGP